MATPSTTTVQDSAHDSTQFPASDSNTTNEFEIKLWDKLQKLYKDAFSPKDKFQTYVDYYTGRFDKKSDIYTKNNDNSCNVIKQIVDAKLTLILDAMMTTRVAPKICSFASIDTINNKQDLADVLDDTLIDIQKENKWEKLRQKSCLWGLLTGMGILETNFNPDKGKYGGVEKLVIDPRLIRWEKSAKELKDSNFVMIDIEISPIELKKKYATNADGSVDDDMISKIDKLIKPEFEKQSKDPSSPKGIISYTSAQGGGQAYTYDQKGLTAAGKCVKLIKVFIKDDSVFLPKSNEGVTEKSEDQFFQFLYPNGRYILMSSDEKNKVIFEDKPIDYKFGYPLDVFNPSELDTVEGKGEVEDLMFSQDRLIRAYDRLRTLIAKYVSIIAIDKSQFEDIKEEGLVNNFVTYIDNMKVNGVPEVITNNTLSEIKNIIEYIQLLKQDMKEIARVNDTILSGLRQPGTTSGEQVKELKEDPMSSIRSIQRNFREFLIETSNKDLALIQEFYSNERIQTLTTGLTVPVTPQDITGQPTGDPQETEAKYAQFSDESVKLLDQAGKAIAELQKTDDIEYQVEIVSGTDVPRSRLENSQLIERMFTQGVLGDPQDPDIKEIYFKAIDLPDYRTYIDAMKAKQSQMQPPMPMAKDLGVSFKDLPDFAKEQWLQSNGFQIPPEGMPPTVPAGMPPAGPEGIPPAGPEGMPSEPQEVPSGL